ncbi:MAG: hypothetical protein GZ094_01660 [Mariniphaga sp.]|nr:hypothetical protein [Mariniphaga sp.]
MSNFSILLTNLAQRDKMFIENETPTKPSSGVDVPSAQRIFKLETGGCLARLQSIK